MTSVTPCRYVCRPHTGCKSTLIDKCQLLDPIADDDDIEWKTDPFEMRPDKVNPEVPDEIIAMIKVSGSPWLQEQLRSLCRELIDIFSTSVRSLPAQVVPMVIDIDRSIEVGGAVQPPPISAPFR